MSNEVLGFNLVSVGKNKYQGSFERLKCPCVYSVIYIYRGLQLTAMRKEIGACTRTHYFFQMSKGTRDYI